MRQNLDSFRPFAVNHSVNVYCAVVGDHSARCIDAASKRLLPANRLSMPALQQPQATATGETQTPAAGTPRRAIDPRTIMSSRPASGRHVWLTHEPPAVVWAALVIQRALST